MRPEIGNEWKEFKESRRTDGQTNGRTIIIRKPFSNEQKLSAMYVFIEMREIKNGARKKSRDVVVDTLLVNRKCCVSSSSFLFTPTKLTGKKKLIFCWPRGRQVKTCLTATQFLVFYFHPSTLHEVAFLATFITPSTLTAPALSKKEKKSVSVLFLA